MQQIVVQITWFLERLQQFHAGWLVLCRLHGDELCPSLELVLLLLAGQLQLDDPSITRMSTFLK